jgi:penicillin G amidase
MKQFAAALKYWGEPGENQVFADTTGKIAWFPAGFTPIRPNSDGLLPLPGDGRYEWLGYLDRDLLPSELNPDRGYIATANQMNLPKNYPYTQRRVSFAWAEDTRFNRISEVLKGLPRVSLEDAKNLQNDYVSLPARRLMDILRAIATPNRKMRAILQWLAEWDDRVNAQSPQAALFEVWVAHHLGPTVIERIAPAVPEKERLLMGTPIRVVELLEHPDTRLGADPLMARDELMLETLEAAVQELERLLGSDRSQWQWGKLATIRFVHALSPVADEVQGLQLNVGPAPESGDNTSVGVAGYEPDDFRVVRGASFRMVLDVGHWDDSVAVNTPGQSGDPSSPHYRDLFSLWLKGEYFPLAYTRAAVTRVTERRIILDSTTK